MEREDDDEVELDVSETSKNMDNDSGNFTTDKVEAKGLAKTNKDEDNLDNVPSGSGIESGGSCSRMYLEDNEFVIESPCGSGGSKKKHTKETKCNDDRETTMPKSHSSIDKNHCDEEKAIPESSEMVKKFGKKTAKESRLVESEDISSTSRKNGEMSSVCEYEKSKRGIYDGQKGSHSRVSMDESKSSQDTDSSKRQKTDETFNGILGNIDKGDVPMKFLKLKSKVRKRNYRVKQNVPDEPPDNADEPITSVSTGGNADTVETDDSLSDEDLLLSTNDDSNLGEAAIADMEITEDDDEELVVNSEEDEEDGQDRDDSDFDDGIFEGEEDDWQIPTVLCKEKPKPQWFVVPEVINRQLGCNRLFQRRFYGSLYTVQRLELMYKLKEHKGCVNTLSFNQKGNLLASGSDDLTVVIWDWPLGKKHHSFKTGHKSNVFQASWLPLPRENLMVTCARDGYVRLADLHKSSVDCSRRLARHEGPATKFSIHPDVPQVILSVGEDAKVFAIDIRENKPTTLLTVKEGVSQIAIYSIDTSPLNSNIFCLGGRDQFVRIYDKRKVSRPLYNLCPENLKNNKNHVHITCAMYNYNGSEIVASYNDEDIYLFDTLLPCPIGDFVHKYQGHRNNATVKGVNFFGPKSEFVISGSDCGNIYIWEKNTEAIVQWMPGDECGVVNRLEPHPHIPVLATSGLDYDVKVWVPSCEKPPPMNNLETCVRYNVKSRAQYVSRQLNLFDGQMLWFLWRRITVSDEPRNRGHGMDQGFGDARNEEDVNTL